MDRTLLETISLLGLDVVFTVVVALTLFHLALEALHRAVEDWAARRRAARASAAGEKRPASGEGAHWPPGPWRMSH